MKGHLLCWSLQDNIEALWWWEQEKVQHPALELFLLLPM